MTPSFSPRPLQSEQRGGNSASKAGMARAADTFIPTFASSGGRHPPVVHNAGVLVRRQQDQLCRMTGIDVVDRGVGLHVLVLRHIKG